MSFQSLVSSLFQYSMMFILEIILPFTRRYSNVSFIVRLPQLDLALIQSVSSSAGTHSLVYILYSQLWWLLWFQIQNFKTVFHKPLGNVMVGLHRFTPVWFLWLGSLGYPVSATGAVLSLNSLSIKLIYSTSWVKYWLCDDNAHFTV